MARRTTSRKGPTSTRKDTAEADTSSALDPKETTASDSAGRDTGATDNEKTLSEGSTDGSEASPRPDSGALAAQAEAAIATADESKLAQDISPPADNSSADELTPATAEPETSTDDASAKALPPESGTAPDEVSAPAADTAEPALADDANRSHGDDTGVPPKAVPASPEPERKGGLFPLLLGGILAGGIGYGAAYFGIQQGTDPAEMSQLRADLSSLRAEMETVQAPPDTAALEAEIAALRDQIADLPRLSETALSNDIEAELAELRAQLGAGAEIDLSSLQARLDEFNDSLSQQATGVADELESLRTALTEAEGQITALGADLDELRDLSERRVIEAEAAVDAALAQSGLDSLRAALETGASYTAAVTRLQEAGVNVPEALAAPAATGIPTLEALQDSFPQAARAGLREALQEAPTESATDRIGNFLRAQVGARSTAPREGDDPDAVLSRVGAAIEGGNLAAALAESEALPASAQAAMDDWLSAVRARLAAGDALPELTNAIPTE